MAKWVEILDHGDDPGRYTMIDGKGLITGCNEDGSIIFRRKCINPLSVVRGLCREPGVRIVKPSQQADILKKINRFLTPQE